MNTELNNAERIQRWRVQSPENPGFHAVIVPETCECQETQIFRLNLNAGDRYVLQTGSLEMHPVLISGRVKLEDNETIASREMVQFDSFYLPGDSLITFIAVEESVLYIAGAKYEGYGKAFYRTFDRNQPVGDIHQIHGTGVGQREVFMTLSDKDEASRLICGLTWGGAGTWTSWPPHQHEKDLEEVYCYFGMPLPHFGFHVSYLNSGEVEDIVTHTVYSGTMVQAPCGYHPTVASPGTRNSYFWVLGALKHESRSYNLAVLDPKLENFNS